MRIDIGDRIDNKPVDLGDTTAIIESVYGDIDKFGVGLKPSQQMDGGHKYPPHKKTKPPLDKRVKRRRKREKERRKTLKKQRRLQRKKRR